MPAAEPLRWGTQCTEAGFFRPRNRQAQPSMCFIQAKGRRIQPKHGQEGPPTRRINLMIWNGGELPQQEFIHWQQCHGQQYHVVIVTETRISPDIQHMSPTHYVLHSACRYAGLMVMVSKQLASPDRVSWQPIEAGGIVHVRVYGKTNQVNILGVYQQAWQGTKVEDCLAARQNILDKLDRAVSGCSKNQILLIGVIFNTDGTTRSPAT